ncbi:MAG: histidine phosphatase family protein [Anaerolineales bacterium]|nr:histidine phosphatase family protein [Anaerolineales bacterium]
MTKTRLHRIILLRHGESVGNLEGRFQGQSDYPLSETGLAQAHALAERWKREQRTFNLIVTSSLARASQTAEIIAGALGCPVENDPLWMEWNNGRYAGRTLEEIEEIGRPEFSTPYTPMGENGESRWELYLRAGHAVQNILTREPGEYLVVAHGGVLGMALYGILGMSVHANSQGPRFYFKNTAFASLAYNADLHRWEIWGFNDQAHWDAGKE